MPEAQLRKAIALAKAGKKEEARYVLSQVVKRNPDSEMGWLWLAGVVENKEQQSYCLKKALQLNPGNEPARQILTKLQLEVGSKKKTVPLPTPTSPEKQATEDDLRSVTAGVFGSPGYIPYDTDKVAEEGSSLLLEICQKIYLSNFGVFELSSPNPEVFLEMGIALGLNKPIIAIAKERRALPSILEGYEIITYMGLADLTDKLSKLRDQGFPQIAPASKDYCHYCGRDCDGMSPLKDENSYLVLENSKLLWRDLLAILTSFLSSYQLSPIHLADSAPGPKLCHLRRKILSSQFTIGSLDKMLSNEASFLALGLAIGSRTPWLLLSERNRDFGPSSLLEVDHRIEYPTLIDLEATLPNTLEPFLKLIVPRRFPKQDKTETISLPFWIDFEQWMVSVTPPTHTPKNIVGQIRVLIYEANNFLHSQPIASEGLLFGRSSECEVVLESSMISAKHFQILKVRERYFITDLYSKNGTYLNGALLNPRNKEEIHVGDIIIVHGTRLVIWDDRPLPEKSTAQTLKVTDLLASGVKRIEFTDIPPPPYLATWDRWLRLVALHPDGYTSLQFEIQDYYPMGRILAELVHLMALPKKEYRFLFRNRAISDQETPLSIGIKAGTLLQISSE